MAGAYRFVVMNGGAADYPALFRKACERLGLPAVIDDYPYIRPHEFSRAKLRDIRRRLQRRHPDEVVVFCPGALEHFVDDADFSFQFSFYRTWDQSRTIVIPHPWSPVQPPPEVDLLWKEKPTLAVGFMGTTYAGSRAARLVAAAPKWLKEWVLDGGLVRHVDLQALMDDLRLPHRYIPTFARFEALEALRRSQALNGDSKLEIVDTAGFDGTAAQMQEFADHLLRMTYVFCPRGCENYSFRVYEALKFGRIPVILDTNMVLPGWIDWEELAVIVPGNSAHRAFDFILEDYASRSVEDFRRRQNTALELARYLETGEWLAAEISRVLGLGGKAGL